MKKNKILSIIFMFCMLTTISCNKKNNQNSKTDSFSNKESKDSTLSSSGNSTSSNKELDYCYFGDTVYVE